MKYLHMISLHTVPRSLPVRGAWVEIHILEVSCLLIMSLPVRGAWVEISGAVRKALSSPSLPVRGAWVEIIF